jgi:hypothetical protein
VVELAWVQAEAGAGVGLWIEVDNQNPTPQLSKARAKIDGRGRLPDTTLLIGNRENAGTGWRSRLLRLRRPS